MNPEQRDPAGDGPGETAEVVKILTPEECAELVKRLVFQGSADDLRDGFIHLSTPAQARGTAEKHFRDAAELWLARIDSAALGDSLRWEESRGGALFPHLYANLRAEQVTAILPLPKRADGTRRFPWDGA